MIETKASWASKSSNPGLSKPLAALITMALTLFCHIAPGAAEQNQNPKFPSHSLTIVVPGSPGGIAHQLGTEMAQALEQELDVKVSIANRPGNRGISAIEYYMSLPPNGFSILQGIDTLASQYANCKISVNPLVDLTPLATAQLTFSQLYIRSDDERFVDWDSFSSFVKKNPGKIKVALFGESGSMESELLNMLETNLGLDFDKKPYRRSSRRYLSVIQEDTDVLIEQPGDIRFFLEQDLLKPILTLLPRDHKPHSALNMTPSFSTLSGEFEELYRFRGFFAHAGTPEDRLEKLEEALKKAIESPQFREYNETKFMNLLGSSYLDIQGSTELIAAAIETYKQISNKTDDCD